MLKTIFYALSISLLLLAYPQISLAENICFSEQEVVDIITLLDASDKDLNSISGCEKLLGEMRGQIERLTVANEDLITQLAQAKQDVIKYQEKMETWRRLAWYSGIVAVIVISVEVIPAVM